MDEYIRRCTGATDGQPGEAGAAVEKGAKANAAAPTEERTSSEASEERASRDSTEERKTGKATDDFLDLELSILDFNQRVLELAEDPDIPILERFRFLSIFSSNLDEFFQVRVSGLFDQAAAGVADRSPDGRLPADQLSEVRSVVTELLDRQEACFRDRLGPELRREGIELVAWAELDADDRADLDVHFRERIFPVLTPLAVDPGHPFPYVSDLSLNLAVVLRDESTDRDLFARVKVPDTLPRWLRVGEGHTYVPLEQVVAANLQQLFPGIDVVEHHTFRVTRNADLSDALDEADDLREAIQIR